MRRTFCDRGTSAFGLVAAVSGGSSMGASAGTCGNRHPAVSSSLSFLRICNTLPLLSKCWGKSTFYRPLFTPLLGYYFPVRGPSTALKQGLLCFVASPSLLSSGRKRRGRAGPRWDSSAPLFLGSRKRGVGLISRVLSRGAAIHDYLRCSRQAAHACLLYLPSLSLLFLKLPSTSLLSSSYLTLGWGLSLAQSVT